MSDAIFIATKASGVLRIGDKREIDRAMWRKPYGINLTPTSRYIRDKLFPKWRACRALAKKPQLTVLPDLQLERWPLLSLPTAFACRGMVASNRVPQLVRIGLSLPQKSFGMWPLGSGKVLWKAAPRPTQKTELVLGDLSRR
jgi:hypothetical protein